MSVDIAINNPTRAILTWLQSRGHNIPEGCSDLRWRFDESYEHQNLSQPNNVYRRQIALIDKDAAARYTGGGSWWRVTLKDKETKASYYTGEWGRNKKGALKSAFLSVYRALCNESTEAEEADGLNVQRGKGGDANIFAIDIMLRVFSFLPPRALVSVLGVCKRWKSIARMCPCYKEAKQRILDLKALEKDDDDFVNSTPRLGLEVCAIEFNWRLAIIEKLVLRRGSGSDSPIPPKDLSSGSDSDSDSDSDSGSDSGRIDNYLELTGVWLGNCQNLKSLLLRYDVTNLSGLGNCPNLEAVSLGPCYEEDLKDFSALGNCPSLKALNMWSYLPNLQGLRFCQSLESLELDNCEDLIDLSELGYCQRLTTLDVYGSSKLMNLTGLGDCQCLTSVTLSHCCPLMDLSELGNCKSLKTLKIHGFYNSQDTDKWRILNSKYKVTLDAPCRSSMDVSALRNCPSLETLKVTDCPRLTDMSALENCRLKSLDVWNCPNLKRDSKFVEQWCCKLNPSPGLDRKLGDFQPGRRPSKFSPSFVEFSKETELGSGRSTHI